MRVGGTNGELRKWQYIYAYSVSVKVNESDGHAKEERARTGEDAGGLVFKAHRLLYHSTLGLTVIKEKKREHGPGKMAPARRTAASPKKGFKKPNPFERSPQTITPKVSTGASKSLYQARPRTVAFP